MGFPPCVLSTGERDAQLSEVFYFLLLPVCRATPAPQTVNVIVFPRFNWPIWVSAGKAFAKNGSM